MSDENILVQTTVFDPATGVASLNLGSRTYRCGLLFAPPPALAPRFNASGFPTLPRPQWRDCTMLDTGVSILDQNPYNACAGFSGVTVFEVAWRLSGRPYKRFSPYYLYSLVNGGRDQGAYLNDINDALMAGVPPDELVPSGAIYAYQIPAAARQAAANFKIDTSFAVETFDEIASCVCLQVGGVQIGIDIGQNFATDQRGVVYPYRRGRQYAGHAMAVLGLKQIDGVWHLEVQNSWGRGWGKAGVCYIGESYFGTNNPEWSAYCYVSPKLNPTDPTAPPVVSV